MIARREETIVPNGSTVLLPGDLLVLAARAFEDRENLSLQEIVVEKGHKWVGRSLRQIPTRSDTLIVMIKRGNETIIRRLHHPPGGGHPGDRPVCGRSGLRLTPFLISKPGSPRLAAGLPGSFFVQSAPFHRPFFYVF